MLPFTSVCRPPWLIVFFALLCALPSWAETLSVTPPTSGVLLWLKADALALNTGDPVTVWTDAGGQGRQATFTRINGAGVAPTFVANAINGKPAVRFAGNSQLRVDALPLAAYTIVTVFTTAAGGEMLYEHSDGIHSYMMNTNGCYLSTGNDDTVSVNRGRVRTEKDAASDHWAATGKPVVSIHTFDGTDDSLRLYANGVLQEMTPAALGKLNTRASVTSPFWIGVHAYFGNMQFHGDLAEIIVYDHALSSAELTQCNTALMRKYGLTGANPLPPDGLVFDFDAGAGVTGTDHVTAWKDQSPNHLVATGYRGKEPALLENGINGKPSLNFPGADCGQVGGVPGKFHGDNEMDLPDVSTYFTGADGGTLFVVYQASASSHYSFTSIHQNNSFTDEWLMYSNQPTGYTSMFRKTRVDGTAPSGVRLDAPQLCTWVSATTGAGTYHTWINGTNMTTNDPDWITPTTFRLSMVNSPYDNMNGGFVGMIGEVVLYNKPLDDATRKMVEATLAKKWGPFK